MARRAILHIGPMKTGSSSIQQWLSQRAPALAAEGVVVPSGFGPNMSRLAAICEAKSLGLEATAPDMARLGVFKGELAALKPSDHTVVVSAEMLGHQLSKPEQLKVLVDLLAGYVDSYRVIVYLRRQDELSVSRYTTALRRGERRARPLSNAIDYAQILDLWTGVFGAEAVVPRIYDRAVMPDGNVIKDFAATAGIPYEDTPEKAIEQNASILPEAQAFLADLARRVRDSGFGRPFETIHGHAAVNRFLSKVYKGKGALPRRADAVAFYEKVAESNELVRAQWFPERATLFSEDFSNYPEDEPSEIPPAVLLEIAMESLVRVVTSQVETGPGTKLGGNLARRALDEKIRAERRAARGGPRRKPRPSPGA